MMNPFRSLTERLSLRVVFALFALYVIWGSTYLGIRIGLNSFPPFLMAGLRFLIAGSTLFVFLRVRGAPAPGWLTWNYWPKNRPMGISAKHGPAFPWPHLPAASSPYAANALRKPRKSWTATWTPPTLLGCARRASSTAKAPACCAKWCVRSFASACISSASISPHRTKAAKA